MSTTERPSLTPSRNSHGVDPLKRQDPQEALGLQTQTSLLRAMAEAVVLSVILVAVFTVGPYAFAKYAGDSKTEQKESKKKEEPKDDKPTKPKTANKTPENPTPKTAAKGQPNIDKGTLDKLGIGKTKTGTPGFNPLERNDDDLLKGLDD